MQAFFMSQIAPILVATMRSIAEGESYTGQAAHLRVTPSAITQRKDTIAKRATAFWGDEVLADAQAQPLWRRQAEQR
jgi:hypothetical protein